MLAPIVAPGEQKQNVIRVTLSLVGDIYFQPALKFKLCPNIHCHVYIQELNITQFVQIRRDSCEGVWDSSEIRLLISFLVQKL